MIAAAAQLLFELSSQLSLGGFKRKSFLCGCLCRIQNVLHFAEGVHKYCCITILVSATSSTSDTPGETGERLAQTDLQMLLLHLLGARRSHRASVGVEQ